jgi:hypothetical protein
MGANVENNDIGVAGGRVAQGPARRRTEAFGVVF